ncbi:recombinase family protein [Alkaliphilus sp. B6464]|uniref:recombinase family protein n=1 Tax=Alkaliphilus sp. B6464 TaxID=2731219 RepID=UPI001BA5168F|nr:recombinase family protein [Alkaliphilus sp. B6464]QUH21464.1 recombinase family protein [Alkaliphilus sp. B6464]
MTKGYCIYLRKSRADVEAESRGEGETLARHENILLELAKKQSLHITQIYKEVVSGETISSRPVMQHLLSEVEQDLWKGVLVVEVERLARGDTIDQGIVAQAFKYSNTKIITPMKVYDPNNEFDEEYFEFGLFMSRREYKTINRRLQRGRLESVKEGKYVGNTPPYGYVRKKLENQKGYTLEIIPDEANVVKLIFELYTKGELQEDGTHNRLGVSLIVRKLNDLKIPTIKGGDWTPATIRGILRNPVYMGKIRWNARPEVKKMVDGKMIKERPHAKEEDIVLVDGLHESIIDEELFELTQKFLKENPMFPVPNKHVVKNPLAGIITCGMCNRKMTRRPYGDKYPDALICAFTSCKNVSSQLSLVEEKLLHALESWLTNYKLNLKSIKNNKSEKNLESDIINKNIDKLNSEIETLQKQLDNLHDLLEQGIYTTKTFLERSKKINDKIEIAKNDRNALVDSLNKSTITEKEASIIIPKIENIIRVYHELDAKAKNILLKEVLNKVVYIKNKSGRWHAKPDDFELELFIELPK